MCQQPMQLFLQQHIICATDADLERIFTDPITQENITARYWVHLCSRISMSIHEPVRAKPCFELDSGKDYRNFIEHRTEMAS